MHGFIGFELHGGNAFGRGFKLDRAEAVAVIEALREWRSGGYEAVRDSSNARAQSLVEQIASIPGIVARTDADMGRAVVTFDSRGAHTAESVAAALSECHPPIWARVEGVELALQTNTLGDDDLLIVAASLREILQS
jgi:selenocysteine lyase/cysteine desulfurase